MTQVSWKRQLGLAIALVALGTFAYWLQFKHKPQTDAMDQDAKKVFSLKDTQVSSVTLDAGKGHDFVLKCSDMGAKLCKPGDNSKWQLDAPEKLRADDSNANSLLSALNNLNVTDMIDLKGETPEKRAALLKEYGLSPQARSSSATRKISVETPAGETVLFLGQTHPIGESIFAVAEHSGKLNEDRVYLVPTYFKSNLEHDLTYWRDKKLLTIAAHDVESFELEGGKERLSATRKAGEWVLHSPKQGDVAGDVENIDNMLTGATYLSAKAFAADRKTDPKAKKILAGARKLLTLTLHSEKTAGAKTEPEPIVLTLFGKGVVKDQSKPAKGAKPLPPKPKQLFATVSNLDPVFELEPYALERLDKQLKDLRLTKLITSMERFSAKRLEFSGRPFGATKLALAESDGKWLTDPGKKEVDASKVQSFLDRISGNRIREFDSTLPPGEQDGVTFVLAGDKGTVQRKLVFWKKAEKLYARDLLSSRKEAFDLDPTIKNDLPWQADYFDKSSKPAAAPAKANTPPVMPPGMAPGMHTPPRRPPLHPQGR